jgi:hypothetical protein
VILLIAAALAIGAPVAAIAAIGDGGGGGSDRTPTQTIQQRDDSTPRDGGRDGDCPFKDGRGSGGGSGSTTQL